MDERTYPKEPLIGVGAVVFKEESVLLIKRGKPPLAETWSLPGGGVKPSETLVDAVVREVREECGIDIEVVDLIKEFEYIENESDGRVKYHYIVFDFKALYKGGSLASSSDALDARCVHIHRLSDYELTAAVKEIICEAAHTLP
jgi:8-oxo-dGTP diphosphatase